MGYAKLTGKKPVSLKPQTLEKIKLMFRQLQGPFEKHCPKNRSNFLSYPFVVAKLLQLLGENELLLYFSLLKGKEKLQTQEDIFSLICEDLDWPIIPLQRE